MKMKGLSLALCFCILSVVFLIFGVISVIACHQGVTAQLAQGIPIEGNELIIFNLYLQSGAQYLAFSALLFLGGCLYQCLNPRKPMHAKTQQEDVQLLPAIEEYEADEENQLQEEEDFDGWSSN